MTNTKSEKTILIAGGLGYIGSHTVAKLAEEYDNLIIVDNLSNSYKSVIKNIEKIIKRKAKFYNVDICSKKLNKVFDNHKITDVIHFAAHKSVSESIKHPQKYYENNVGGTINLLNVMISHGVKNIIFSSSCTVYGKPDSFPVTEGTPTKPAESPYGNSKKICEEILIDYAKSGLINSVILRYFNPIGSHPSGLIFENPKGKPENLMPYLISVINRENAVLKIFGVDYNTHDGTAIRDYINVNDLASAHAMALKIVQNKSYEIFNIGSGIGYSVLDIIKSFEKQGITIPYQVCDRRDGDIEAIWSDISKVKAIMNWEPQYNLDNTIQSIVKTLRK